MTVISSFATRPAAARQKQRRRRAGLPVCALRRAHAPGRPDRNKDGFHTKGPPQRAAPLTPRHYATELTCPRASRGRAARRARARIRATNSQHRRRARLGRWQPRRTHQQQAAAGSDPSPTPLLLNATTRVRLRQRSGARPEGRETDSNWGLPTSKRDGSSRLRMVPRLCAVTAKSDNGLERLMFPAEREARIRRQSGAIWARCGRQTISSGICTSSSS